MRSFNRLYRWFIRIGSGSLEVAKHPNFKEPSRPVQENGF